MEKFNVINFHRTRDFGNKINATFEFIRQNFKSLVKSILFIAGPPVLIASLLLGSFMGDMMNMGQASQSGSNMDVMSDYFLSVSFWLQMVLMFIFLIVSSVMTLATINNYIVLYEEKQSNAIEVHEVWQRVRETFWMYLGTLFLFGLMAMVVYLVLLIPFVLLAAISPVLIFFGAFFFFGFIIYLAISVSLTIFIRGYEKLGFFDALARSYKLVQGKWWSTFGLLVVLYMIMMFSSYIFLMPWYIVTIVGTLHNLESGVVTEPSSTMQILMIVFFSLYYLVQMILNTLPNIGVAFQYFNLVELKEAKGLLSSIESIGQNEPPAAPQDEHY
ncbi:MAG TPA: hypothetical protein VGK59_06615 [Ohtaekwangia sp.]